ncbi:MAG: hypothetical protein WCG81_14450 [Candidatus Angelobacter sp.]
MFRKNGEQCKAPAEKDSGICYAHAQQQAMALRRKLELAILLAEVARQMRALGRADFEVEDIFMDSDAMQITLAIMAKALIDGRIDCKTAGRLAVGLQTAMKLLRLSERTKKGRPITKQMNSCADQPEFLIPEGYVSEARHFSEARREDEIHVMDAHKIAEMDVIRRNGFHWDSAHAPPELKRAA